MAAAQFEAWRSSPSGEAFDRFEQADAETTRLCPNSASAWATSGESFFLAFSELQSREPGPAKDSLAKSVAAYRRAVQLYPNSGLYEAKLAVALDAVGDRSAFRRAAETALRLDKITPHADKKLPADLRKKLQRGLGKAD